MITKIEETINGCFARFSKLRPALSALVWFGAYLLLSGVMYWGQTRFPAAETALRLCVTPFATATLCLCLWRLADIRPNDPRRSVLHRSVLLIFAILLVFYVIGAVGLLAA